jgi:antitoxin component YwqK of YwqJK toxin-antitoxin module/Flp pilus assembly protein TadD
MLRKTSVKVLVPIFCLLFTASIVNAQKEYGIVNSGELIKKGAEFHDEQKYDEALALYNQVPENDTNYALATAEKAFSYYAKKDYDKAISLCEEALKYGTDYDNNLYVTLGSSYDDAGKGEKALEVYNKGIKEFPKNHLILFNKAVTLEKQEKYEEAIETYKQVLQLTPYHASTHYRLGRLAELEGDITRAMLCYNTFLVVEPTTDRALSVLQMLDNMVSRKYDDSKAKGIKFSEKGEDFSEIETLIRKQLALNKNYKVESKADYPVIRQNQALLSYLPTHKGKQGFWETFYVPFYAQLYKEGRFEGFSYYLLASSDNDKIKALLVKNKGDLTKFNEWQSDAFRNATSKRKIDIDGKPTDVLQIYYKGGSLYGVGPYPPAMDKKIGKWEFYHTNGKVLARGSYNSNGEQTGEWKYYHANGKLKKEAVLAAEKENGPYKIYYVNGNIKESGSFAAGELHNEIKTYTWYGGLDEVHNFKNGVHEGKYEEYYPNGKLKFNSAYAANKLSGVYKYYHPDGKLNIDGNIKDDLKEGLFTVYFRDGKVQLKKTYVGNKENGAFTKYYNSGQLRQEGNYKNEKPVGTWKSYYLNGQLDEVTNYNDAGNEQGIQQYFDVDGKMYFEGEYKDGRLVQFKFLDKAGKVVTETKLKAKQEVKTYHSNGNVRWAGSMENGKRNGLWKEYEKNGLLIGEYNYKDGTLNGSAKAYYYTGKVMKEFNYKDGNLHGEYKEYFRNGKLYKSCWYENGAAHGDVKLFTREGVRERVYTLFNDRMNGKSYNYDPEGKLNAIEKYEKGIFTGLAFFDTAGNEIRTIAVDKEKIEVEFPSVINEVLMKRTYINGSKEGLSSSYYSQGKLANEGNYLNDEREGTWKWYNPDNTLNVVRNYQLGSLHGVNENYDLFGKLRARYDYVDGSIHGKGEVYYYNGNKKQESNYWDDDLHGSTKYYGYNGEHVLTLIYDHGVLANVVYVNGSGGKPDTIAAPLNGTLEAKYANGKVAFHLEYKNAYDHGKYQEFFEDGTLCREAVYVDDMLEGERKTWYRNGKLRSSENFKFDNSEGLTTLYNENGTKKAELNYKNDILHGPVKYYDAAGKLIAHYIFYNGDIVKKLL